VRRAGAAAVAIGVAAAAGLAGAAPTWAGGAEVLCAASGNASSAKDRGTPCPSSGADDRAAPARLGLRSDDDARRQLFTFADERIIEASGLAASARHPGVVYTHNDSDDGPRIFAVGQDGRTRAVLTLRGATARDWEAIAPGRGASGRPVLWIGDIGDNRDSWEDISVYRVTEPSRLRTQDVPWTRYRLRYADGPRNAEALLVDPRTQRLYVVSKRNADAAVYAAPQPLRTDRVNVLRRVAAAPETVTDGAFVGGGRYAVLRDYFSASVYDRRWRRVASFGLPLQFLGEAVAATPDGRAVLTTGEGAGAAVWRVPLPDSLFPPAPTTLPPPPRTAAPGGPARGPGSSSGVGIAVVALAGGAMAAWAWGRRR
jgi:hypothetical protein